MSFISHLATAEPIELHNFVDKCEKVQENLGAIRQWTTSRGSSCELSSKPIGIGDPQFCSADISKCLPPEVLTYNGKSAQRYGPNCWNLALVMAGVIPALRYSTPEEMAFFMNSPLCRTLKANEKRRPGDIGAMRAKGEEIHGFMWVSDDIVYSKNGPEIRDHYSLQTRAGMEKSYEDMQRAECKAHPKEPCELTVDTIRCRSLEDYLRDPETKTPKAIQEAFIRLEHAEKCTSGLAMRPEVFSFDMKLNLSHTMEVLAALFASPEFQATLKSLPEDQEKFYKQSFVMRLNSMSTQLIFTEKKVDCLICKAVSKEMREAISELNQRK